MSIPTTDNENYGIENNCLCRIDADTPKPLCNFAAWITHEIRYYDGETVTRTTFVVAGIHSDGTNYDPIQVDSAKFRSMTWISDWGIRPIIWPGQNNAADCAIAIQLLSTDVTTEHVYTHIGWTTHEDRPIYLHARGAITAHGNDQSFTVQLPDAFSRYNFAGRYATPDAAVDLALTTLNLAPHRVTWPLLAHVFRAPIGAINYGLHVTGRTGSGKSEVTSVFQSFWGAQLTANNLPASWTSTANALEAQSHIAKDAIFAVDDFCPTGTAAHQRKLNQAADTLFRAAGNQAGRARMSDQANLKSAFFPRGAIISTGEDVPRGHSLLGRIFALELSPTDVDFAGALTTIQKHREQLPCAMVHYLTWLATGDNLERSQDETRKIVAHYQTKYAGIGHSRAPSIIGNLCAGAVIMTRWMHERFPTIMTAELAKSTKREALKAIVTTARMQSQLTETADPVDQLMTAIRQSFGQHHCHARTRRGGIPDTPVIWGWSEKRRQGEAPDFASHGPCVAWIDWKKNEFLLDAEGGYATIRKLHPHLASTNDVTLWKRCNEAGILSRIDDKRGRNTVRATCHGAVRKVVAIQLSRLVPDQQSPDAA